MMSTHRRVLLGLLLAGGAGACGAVTFERVPSLFARDAPTGLEDRYGVAVAADGDTVAIGTGKRPGPLALGQVDIWVRREGAWEKQATLPNPSVTGRFGHSLALEGDRLLVGSPSSGHAQETGVVVAYRREGEAWVREATLLGSARAYGDAFGYSLALEHGRALIGAPGKDGPGGENQGALYVFDNDGAAWHESARLEAADAHAGDLLGASVAWSGDLALGGAVGVDIGTATGQGAVVGFAQGNGGWHPALTLLAPGGAGGDSFGVAMAADAARLVVGAHLDNVAGRTGAGSAQVFTRVGATFVPEATLLDDDPTSGALGYRLALSGDTIVLGGRVPAPRVFRREGAAWVRGDAPSAPLDALLESVALTGETLVMGAPGTDVGTATDRGAVAIAARSAGGWTTQALLTSPDFDGGTTFGYALDIDQGQAVVGGPGLCTGFCPPTWMPGAAYFFARTAHGSLGHARTLTGTPPRFGDGFAHAVAIRGARAIVASGGGFDWQEHPEVAIFERDDAGWHRAATLRDAQGEALVASHVAIDGDIAVVGDRFDLHLFHRGDDGGWRHEARFPAGLRGAYALTALVVEGATVALGAAGYSGEAPSQGVVYVLGRRAGRWFLDARLLGDSKPHAGFGAQLALDGGHLLIGEQGDPHAAVAGGVLAYQHSDMGWRLQGRLALPPVSRVNAGIAVRGDLAFAFAGQAVHAFEWRAGAWQAAGDVAATGPLLAFDGETLLVSKWDADLDQTREVEVYRIAR